MTVDRYARHSLIDWFDQDAIRRQRLIVVGAGAVGNEVLKNLALLGVGELAVYDRDTVEAHNLTRSVLFRESDVGQAKALCAAVRLRELDPSVRITPFVGDFWAYLTLVDVATADAVFSCVDNFEARVRLNRLCAITGTPLINVGIDSRFCVVEHFGFTANERVPCYECGLPATAYAAMARRYSCGGLRRVAVAENKVPTTILTSSAAASLAVSVHLRSAADGVAPHARRYFHDSFTGHTTDADIARLEGCPGCGDLLDRRLTIAADRRIEPRLLTFLRTSNVGPIFFSDRILTSVRCGCTPDEPSQVIFRVADCYDETLVRCPKCGERSREVGLRDQFSLEELVRDYGGRTLPGKFVMSCHDDLQLFVELQGDQDDERGKSDSANRGPHAEGGGNDPA